MTLKDDYSQLMDRNKELSITMSAGAILYWDMETKMPPRGVELKSQQIAWIQKTAHRMLTDKKNGEILGSIKKAENYNTLSEIQKRNVYLAEKTYKEATMLPEELVVETSKQGTKGVNVWKKAKATNDWALFMPELQKMKDLKEKEASLLMDIKGAKNPYDALIDNYEPRMTAEHITHIFDEMKTGLRKIMNKLMDQDQPSIQFTSRKVPESVQKRIGEDMAGFVKYDIKSEEAGGRIDTTEHPFTTGYYTDVRITTNYHEDMFFSSVYSILHEAGHALYEQGLPMDWMYQPIGTSSSYGVHESMSRFIENMVGRSSEFWSYYMPRLRELTGDTFKDITVDHMIKAANHVTPNKIRIEADEVTYGLHIIIRFELERDLFNGKLQVSELPQAWNDKYREYLGVEIENDSEGVMQDTHWGAGSFGYFPSYALGNIYDGLWLTKLNKDMPDWLNGIKNGSFGEVKKWLTENVYRYGNLYDPEDLVKHVTGSGLDVKPFINYLDHKFSKIYGI